MQTQSALDAVGRSRELIPRRPVSYRVWKRGFDLAVIEHPALAAAAGDGRALVLVVAIALTVGADEFAAQHREESRAEGHAPTTRSMNIAPLVRARPE